MYYYVYLLCISNEISLVDLLSRLIANFSDLTLLQTYIIANESDIAFKTELVSNNT